MTTIMEAVKAADIQTDKLFQAGKLVQIAECLPQDTKDALLKHLSDARDKHPQEKPDAPSAPYAQPDSRPGPVRAAVGKAVDRAVAVTKGK